MLQAMCSAPTGDDVFGDDPSVIALQQYAATIFGKEAGLFCPSGVMANQVALLALAKAGTPYLCNEFTHTYYFETGGPATMNGIHAVLCNHSNGKLEAGHAALILNSQSEITVAVIENTVNKGGGIYYTMDELKKLSELFRMHKIKIHLDGARIFNALAETADPPAEVAKLVDTVSFCLSKGLGAPAGSMLLGPADIIAEARRIRNKLGGAMRQAGHLAAAGLFALKNHVQRLKEDHLTARTIASALKRNRFITEVMETPTNIVIAKTESNEIRDRLLNDLRKQQVLAVPFGEGILRMVTHLNITPEMAERAARMIESAGW
jgi:threonine aldolase